jgi:hypothetical protein
MKYLHPYIENSEDPAINFLLGQEYENIGQTGAAVSFYLRTAERSTTDQQQYEALMRCCICLEKQKTRDDTEKGLLLKAIALLSDRPEAYFLLSRLHEKRREWQESYTTAVLGLTYSNFDHTPVIIDQYPGYCGLMFQKGVASWHVGLTEQSRQIMVHLKDNFKLHQIYIDAINHNLKICGLPKSPLVVENKSAPAVHISRQKSDKINSQSRPGVWIVDNFYQDPDAIRKFALEQEYDQGGIGKYYIGNRTRQQFLFPGLKEEFEYIMNRRIEKWEGHGMNGRFQVCKEGEPLVYHCDPQRWAGMLYLTPNAPYQTGTSTHALKGTDVRHLSHPDISKCFRPGSQNLDRTIFEPVDNFGNVYNRLVIFNAGYLHSATDYFGYNNDNCRLWQMFFFD